MNRRGFLQGAAASAAFCAVNTSAATRKPNIVIILADDFGYGSLSCNGADPKRSSLLKEGYGTAAIGKWHLGYGTSKTDFIKELKPGPLELGFDYHFGVPQNHGDASGVYVENHWVAGLRSAENKPAGLSPYGRPFLEIDAPQRVDDEVMDVLTDHAEQPQRAPGFPREEALEVDTRVDGEPQRRWHLRHATGRLEVHRGKTSKTGRPRPESARRTNDTAALQSARRASRKEERHRRTSRNRGEMTGTAEYPKRRDVPGGRD
jgi:arylsulfatase A-like enzyme